MADPPPLPELRFTEIPATSRHRYVGDRFCSFVAGATQGSLWRGADGSNPPPSSAESANYRLNHSALTRPPPRPLRPESFGASLWMIIGPRFRDRPAQECPIAYLLQLCFVLLRQPARCGALRLVEERGGNFSLR